MQLPNVQHTVIPWIGKVSKFMGMLVQDYFKQHQIDLTKEQWILLKNLYEEDGQQQSNLAYITERNKSSLTRLVATMERKKLIKRKASKSDKRANLVFLTKQGRHIFEQTLPIMNAFVEQLQEGLTEQEITNTIQVLERIYNNITNDNQDNEQ